VTDDPMSHDDPMSYDYAAAESDDPDRALAGVLTPDALLEQVRLRRAEGTYRQCDAALKLLEWYGRLREPAEVAALLALLEQDQVGRADRQVVAQGAALGRPAAESARIAAFLADRSRSGPRAEEQARIDEYTRVSEHARICALAASFRTARDLAGIVDTLVSEQHGAMAEALVVRVAEQRGMDIVARLELSLRAKGLSDLASRSVQVALDRRGVAAEIAELIDHQFAYGPVLAQESLVSGPVATHIREQMPEDKLVDFVLRQYLRDPGRALAWSAAVAESARRPITSVVELFARVSAGRHTDLAEKITATVARHRGAEDLIAYAAGCGAKGWDIFEQLFSRVSVEASAEVISDLMQLWNAQRHTKNAQLCGVLAEHAPADTLAGAATHLAARTWQSLADELLRTALERPERFEPAQVAALLAGISPGGAAAVHPRRRGDILKSVLQKLDGLLSTEPEAPIGVPYLAELACAITEGLPEARAAQARALIGSMMFETDDRRLPERYYNTLRALGRNDLAEEFRHAELGTLEWDQLVWSSDTPKRRR
jgi:hypothetical protein